MKLYGRVNGVETEIGGGGASIQVTSLPTASASLVGTIYQYVGTTSPGLGVIHSHFYECASGSTVGTYEWRDVSNFIPVIDNIDDVGGKVVDGTIFYYVGTTTAALTTGCLYKAMVSETSPGIYAYGYQPVIPMQMDSTPTENSTNPVTSGGVYAAIQSGGGGSKWDLLLDDGVKANVWTSWYDYSTYDGIMIGTATTPSSSTIYTSVLNFLPKTTLLLAQGKRVYFASVGQTDYCTIDIDTTNQKFRVKIDSNRELVLIGIKF